LLVRSEFIGHSQDIDYFYLRLDDGKLLTFIIFVDEASHKVIVKDPSNWRTPGFVQALESVSNYYVHIRNQQVRKIVSDNEGAVISASKMENLKKQIEFEFVAPYTKVPLAERYIGVLKLIIKALLVACGYLFPRGTPPHYKGRWLYNRRCASAKLLFERGPFFQ
jgi:hypothetical protein